jgi:hypothetical protein
VVWARGVHLVRVYPCSREDPVTGPAAPPLAAEIYAALRRMRLPYLGDQVVVDPAVLCRSNTRPRG